MQKCREDKSVLEKKLISPQKVSIINYASELIEILKLSYLENYKQF
jgi:hypothetical protein